MRMLLHYVKKTPSHISSFPENFNNMRDVRVVPRHVCIKKTAQHAEYKVNSIINYN